jgi:hypothetical protein
MGLIRRVFNRIRPRAIKFRLQHYATLKRIFLPSDALEQRPLPNWSDTIDLLKACHVVITPNNFNGTRIRYGTESRDLNKLDDGMSITTGTVKIVKEFLMKIEAMPDTIWEFLARA